MRRTYTSIEATRPDPTRTAVPLQYPFYVIRVNHFLEMKVLRPHQELTAQGIVKEWDPSMKNVLFLSHQWTSWAHPDHTGEQLRTMQRLLTRMLSGDVGTVEPTFADKGYLPAGLKVTSEEWKELLIHGDVFIWMDLLSMPQPGTFRDRRGMEVATSLDELIKAVRSIPAYVELSSHFFVLCPAVVHKDTGELCDYGSWLDRGWCRLEQMSLALSCSGENPVIVVTGPEATPFMIGALTRIAHMPGLGDFTCCALNHRKSQGGVMKSIPCDKQVISQLLEQMVRKRMELHLGRNQLLDYRLWKAYRTRLQQGMGPEAVPERAQTMERFLEEYRFCGPCDEEVPVETGVAIFKTPSTATGMTPITIAVMEGNPPVLRELIASGANPKAKTAVDYRQLGISASTEMLQGFAVFCGANHEQVLRILVDAGVDVNEKGHAGLTPLSAAVASLNAGAVDALLEVGADINVHAGFAGGTPLSDAAFTSSSAIVQQLLDARGDPTELVQLSGNNALMSASQNPKATPEMLAALLTESLDINTQARSLTSFGRMLFLAFRAGAKLCRSKYSSFAMEMAHTEGSTALHYAAMHVRALSGTLLFIRSIAEHTKAYALHPLAPCNLTFIRPVHAQGHIALASFLIENGAFASLHLRDSMGCTPLAVANKFGPHPECERLFASVMVDMSAAEARYVERRGRQLASEKDKAHRRSSEQFVVSLPVVQDATQNATLPPPNALQLHAPAQVSGGASSSVVRASSQAGAGMGGGHHQTRDFEKLNSKLDKMYEKLLQMNERMEKMASKPAVTIRVDPTLTNPLEA